MPLRILVVEDDRHMVQGICDALTLAGYETQPASNGSEALACLEQGLFDLILSDIMMPIMDGYELFNQVRSNPAWAATPFIFLTAKGQKVDIRLGKRLGADDYLVKPFEIEDLLVAVSSKIERVKVVRQVANAELARLKQGILNTLSHEFRTPLTYISGYTELLQSAEFDARQLKDVLSYIRKGSDRLKRLVEDFLFVVMIETGEIESLYRLECAPCDDLVVQIAKRLDSMETLAAARHVELKRHLPDSLPVLLCHSAYLVGAVERLVSNGIKFSKRSGGVVQVRAWADDNAVYFAVSDEGIGVSPDEQARLFELFSQINRERMEQQGTGVGLFIVKQVATLHGGRVEVQSEPGMGSTFTIILPRPATALAAG